jgi:hypothetical protein
MFPNLPELIIRAQRAKMLPSLEIEVWRLLQLFLAWWNNAFTDALAIQQPLPKQESLFLKIGLLGNIAWAAICLAQPELLIGGEGIGEAARRLAEIADNIGKLGDVGEKLVLQLWDEDEDASNRIKDLITRSHRRTADILAKNFNAHIGMYARALVVYAIVQGYDVNVNVIDVKVLQELERVLFRMVFVDCSYDNQNVDMYQQMVDELSAILAYFRHYYHTWRTTVRICESVWAQSDDPLKPPRDEALRQCLKKHPLAPVFAFRAEVRSLNWQDRILFLLRAASSNETAWQRLDRER